MSANFALSGKPSQKSRRRRGDNGGQFEMSIARAAATIPKSDIADGPCQVLLWKVNKYGAVIPIRSLEVKPDQPLLGQVEAWAGENGWDITDHREPGGKWAAITTMVNPSEPWASCYKMRYAKLAETTSMNG